MEVKVESFQLDHRTVKAPYVRKAGRLVGPKGDVIAKYDIRLVQPNMDAIPTGGLHTLEHLFAVYFRDYMEGIIDISPMGCRTGFYMIKFGDTPEKEIEGVLKKVLERIINTKEEEVPATNEVQCGNYRDHSLFTAKEYAKEVLEKLQ
ncbi:S-ribosylhomocysteine lyase [Caldanaerobius polysaccharolyticus]|uniref:S-ribosylhomocysteine lyase n=1 Tax=Caldanaerobius polysaccharolyticus TaxID=44256 RepID=UPI000479C218|nr:S-ribosylhomocysteine lyase [Caldanaerobius polysaccharolyticus]